ncbi:MAG: CoA transferase [Syntrophaceae bacterium]|nr:CoA transferase [Syntrophaceae bacterium]
MNLPLNGIRIADFTWVGAGPFVTKALADHGADVIKVESATRVDVIRKMHPFAGGTPGVNRSGYYSNRNSSKRSITLNLKNPMGLEVAKRLIAVSNVVADNFTTGTMEKLGLGYDAVKAIKPDIICLSMPMQGAHGPHSQYRGYGVTIGALSGFYNLIGYPDRDPVGTGTNFPDHVPNPTHACVAILAALIHHKRTGEGQFIELSQFESTMNLFGAALLDYSVNRREVTCLGNRLPYAAPHGVYPCVGNDRWVCINCFREKEWMTLCDVMGKTHLVADSRFNSLTVRLKNMEELDREISEWTSSKDPFEVMKLLQSCGIPAGVVEDSKDTLERDEQLAARKHWTYLEHPEMGHSVYDAPPYKLSRTPGYLRSYAPLLGEHTRQVCLEDLEMESREYERLEREGAFK